jgi:PAS domain S-box-containing protein
MPADFVDPRRAHLSGKGGGFAGSEGASARVGSGWTDESLINDALALSEAQVASLTPLLDHLGTLVGAPVHLCDRLGRRLTPETPSEDPAEAQPILADMAGALEGDEDTVLRSLPDRRTAWGTRLAADGVRLANLIIVANGNGAGPLTGAQASTVLPLVRSMAREIARRLVAEIQARDARNMVVRLATRGTTEALAAESRLTRMAAQVPGVLYQYRLWPDGRVAFPYATEGIRDIYGVSPADARDDGLAVANVIHPDDLDRIVESILESARALTTWHEEYRVNHPTRGLIHVEGRSHPEPLPDGSVLWHGLIMDVTERVRQQEALRAAQDRYRMVARTLRYGTWTLDLKAGMFDVDAGFMEMLGFEAQAGSLSYDHWLSMLHPDDAARQWEVIGGQIARGDSFTAEFRYRTADDDWLWVEVRGHVTERRDGRPLRMVGTNADISRRKAAEEALKASEQEKALVLSSISDIITYYTGPDLRMAWSNMATAALAGIDSETLKDRTCHSVWFDSDSPCAGCPVLKAFETGQPATGAQTTPDGRHWALKAFPMRDDSGELVGVVEVARDVSEEERRKHALERANADLKQAQRIAAIGNWSFDPAVGVPVWSDEIYRIYERDPALPPPTPADYDTLYEGEDLDRFRAAITAAIRDGIAYDITLCLRLPDRPAKWVRAIGEPEAKAGPAGHVVHGTIQDITEEKRTRDALLLRKRKLRVAMDIAADGIWEFEVETGAAEWNNRFFEMLGHEPGAFQESFDAWRRLVHPDDWPRVERAGLDSIETGIPFETEYRIRKADGSWLWVWDHGRPVEWNRQGDVSRMIGTVTDIDARKRKELADLDARITAERNSHAKSEFLAATSHELRTPLNAILGFSEMMKDEMLGSLGNETYRQYAADIHAAGSHLTDLINSVLDLAKIEAGRRDLTIERLDAGEMVLATIHLVEQRATSAGLTLERSVAPDLPPLMADSLAVRQVLFNLLSNAIKYTPRGGRVSITATQCGQGGVAIRVADTGIGISPEDQARLFQPFTRAEEVERRQIEGTGLGLALVKSLMDLHGGTATVESAPGEGSMFTVCFPPGKALP